MKTYKFDKMIRDDLLQRMHDKGIIVHLKSINDENIIDYYKAKLVEESKEVQNSDDRQELIEELADLTEVIAALMVKLGINAEEVEYARVAKKEAKGGFSKAVVVDTVDIDPEHEFAIYYAANPDKYPEVV